MATQPYDPERDSKTEPISSMAQAPPYQDTFNQNIDRSESSKLLPKSNGRGVKAWRAPLVIAITLAAGLGFALAHHFINAYLDGQEVIHTTVKQAWILRGQTMFAFLVRMFLTLCVGASFIQRQWYNFQREKFTVYEIDAVTAVLEDPLNFRKLRTWRKVPLLAFAAFISWTMPLAAVITPGALSIVPRESPQIVDQQVPQLLFDTSNWESFTDVTTARSAPLGTYIQDYAATTELWQVALSVAVSGHIATLPMPSQNMTYHYQFYGPALKCDGIPNATEFSKALATAEQRNLTNQYYTSWATSSEVGAGVYVARGNGNGYDGAPALYSNTNITECRLHNGSYEVGFQFQFAEQNITVLGLNYSNPEPLDFDTRLDNEEAIADRPRIAYGGIMEAFEKMLVGSINSTAPTEDSTSRQIVEATSAHIVHIDWSEAETTRWGLEQLFQNITLSLFSRSSFTKNATQAEMIPVIVSEFVNVYRYDQADIFIAYGMALLGTMLCAAFGLHATWANKGSYRNIFSTFIRSSDDGELRPLIHVDDDGRDPLPEPMREVELIMHKRRQI